VAVIEQLFLFDCAVHHNSLDCLRDLRKGAAQAEKVLPFLRDRDVRRYRLRFEG
jgi:hypothetical protein